MSATSEADYVPSPFRIATSNLNSYIRSAEECHYQWAELLGRGAMDDAFHDQANQLLADIKSHYNQMMRTLHGLHVKAERSVHPNHRYYTSQDPFTI